MVKVSFFSVQIFTTFTRKTTNMVRKINEYAND